MMELDGPVITEAAHGATQGFLESFEPGPEVLSPSVLSRPFARATLVPAIPFIPKNLAHLKTAFVLLHQTVAAHLSRTRQRLRLLDSLLPESGRDNHAGIVGVPNRMAVGAEDNTFGNLVDDRFPRCAAAHHVRHRVYLLVPVSVMKVQGAVVRETATGATKRLLE
jgi:hypothetical protein